MSGVPSEETLTSSLGHLLNLSKALLQNAKEEAKGSTASLSGCFFFFLIKQHSNCINTWSDSHLVF